MLRYLQKTGKSRNRGHFRSQACRIFGPVTLLAQITEPDYFYAILSREYVMVSLTGRGGRIARARVSRAGDRAFEPMVE